MQCTEVWRRLLRQALRQAPATGAAHRHRRPLLALAAGFGAAARLGLTPRPLHRASQAGFKLGPQTHRQRGRLQAAPSGLRPLYLLSIACRLCVECSWGRQGAVLNAVMAWQRMQGAGKPGQCLHLL